MRTDKRPLGLIGYVLGVIYSVSTKKGVKKQGCPRYVRVLFTDIYAKIFLVINKSYIHIKSAKIKRKTARSVL